MTTTAPTSQLGTVTLDRAGFTATSAKGTVSGPYATMAAAITAITAS